MSNKVVSLGGYNLYPTTVERSDFRVGTQLRMADGSLRFFHRAIKRRWTLTWENIPEGSSVSNILSAWSTTTSQTFVDEYGTSYTVIITDKNTHDRNLEAGNISVPGTIYYSISIGFETT